jgi:hypothetical protein
MRSTLQAPDRRDPRHQHEAADDPSDGADDE